MENGDLAIMGVKRASRNENNALTALDVLATYAVLTRLMHSLTERKKSSQIKWLTVYVLELCKAEPGLTHAQIRRYYGTSCGALTGMLTENVNNGCLRATPDEADRRRTIYHTTEQGLKYLEDVYAGIDKVLIPYNTHLTDEDRANFIKGQECLNRFVYEVDRRKYHSDTPYDTEEPSPFA